MLLATIKIRALQLMFAAYYTMTPANIAEYYGDANCSEYLNAMNGSIDRCVERFKSERLIPTKTLVLTDLGTEGTYRTVYDLTDIADFYAIDRIIFEDESGNYEQVGYIIESDNLLIENTGRSGEFRLIYYPTIESADTLTDDEVMPLPDPLCSIIPLFIKGELFQEAEPNLASEARNLFEQNLLQLKNKNYTRQTRVKVVFKP